MLIEQTHAGTFRASGKANDWSRAITHFMPPQFGTLQDALDASQIWAGENDVAVIYVCAMGH